MVLQTNLQAFMETSIGRVKTTLQALHLLDRFSRLNIKKLGIEEKYRQLFLQFGDDIEAVKHVWATENNYDTSVLAALLHSGCIIRMSVYGQIIELDILHWLMVRQRIEFKICLLVYKCLLPPFRSVPRVHDHSSLGSVDTSSSSPFCWSGWRHSSEDQNCRLRSSKFLHRWSLPLEHTTDWHQGCFTDCFSISQPAKNWDVSTQLLCTSAAVITVRLLDLRETEILT